MRKKVKTHTFIFVCRFCFCRKMTFTTSKTTSAVAVAQEENLEDYPDRVSAIYVGKTILVTGGTGFMGKVLVEKLLRCCTGVKRIYLLVRSKKGKDPNERLKDVFNNPVINHYRLLNFAPKQTF